MSPDRSNRRSAKGATLSAVSLAFAALVAVPVPPAIAQAILTLGEIRSHGGKRLGADEIAKTVTGATMVFRLAGMGESSFEFGKGGELTATGLSSQGGRVSGAGSWKTDADGRLCMELNWNQPSAKPMNSCQFLFDLHGRYYVSNSDTERSANAFERTVKRP